MKTMKLWRITFLMLAVLSFASCIRNDRSDEVRLQGKNE